MVGVGWGCGGRQGLPVSSVVPLINELKKRTRGHSQVCMVGWGGVVDIWGCGWLKVNGVMKVG